MHDSDPISCKQDYYRARLSLRVQVPSICNKRAGIGMARKFFMLFSFLFPLLTQLGVMLMVPRGNSMQQAFSDSPVKVL